MGQDAEGILVTEFRDMLFILIFLERHIVHVELTGIAVIRFFRAPTLGTPPLVVVLAERHFPAIRRQYGGHGRNGGMVSHLPSDSQGLDLEITAALAILTVEQPAKGVIYRGLARSIVAVDGCAAATEVQLQAAASFEIFDFQGIQLQNH